MTNAKTGQMIRLKDNSGACATIVIVIGEDVYIANIGDCRAILSADNGKHVTALSIDHTTKNKSELTRIEKAGGRIERDGVSLIKRV